MKKFFIVSAIIFICVMLMALNTNLYSQQVKKSQTIKKVDTARLQLKFKTDLRVDVIHSWWMFPIIKWLVWECLRNRS
jgi:hypothetical protein